MDIIHNGPPPRVPTDGAPRVQATPTPAPTSSSTTAPRVIQSKQMKRQQHTQINPMPQQNNDASPTRQVNGEIIGSKINHIKLNRNVHITCAILKLVAASADEARLGALFLNGQEAKILRLTLSKMGHPQPPIPIHVNNTTTVGIVNATIKCQHSRAMEMRYFWMLCQEAQRMFDVSHHPGAENLGNYQTKAHSAPVCDHVRPVG